MSVLCRGLGYAPTNNFNMFSTLMDINTFARTLPLKHHFLKPHDNLNNNVHDIDFVGDLSISENTVSSDRINGSPLPSPFVSFNDLCHVGTLRSLESESKPSSFEGDIFRLPNPPFFPHSILSRGIRCFSGHVEKDLSELHASIRREKHASEFNL